MARDQSPHITVDQLITYYALQGKPIESFTDLMKSIPLAALFWGSFGLLFVWYVPLIFMLGACGLRIAYRRCNKSET